MWVTNPMGNPWIMLCNPQILAVLPGKILYTAKYSPRATVARSSAPGFVLVLACFARVGTGFAAPSPVKLNDSRPITLSLFVVIDDIVPSSDASFLRRFTARVSHQNRQ
jgi:hypothetical protein